MTDYWSLNQAWKRASCQAIRRALGSGFHIQKVQGLKFVGYEFRSFSACGGCFYSSCPKIDGDQPIIEFLRPLPFLRHRSVRIKWAGLIQDDPVPNFHEEFAGASSKSLAIVVLEIFASESDGGRTLVAYSISVMIMKINISSHPI